MDDLLALFTQAAKLLREAADEAMSRHGVRVGQHIVLSALWEQDGLTPGEIARRLGTTTPTIVNTATRMEEAGLLAREPDPADARLVRLYLSPRGRSAREPVREARAALEEHATATLTGAERAHLCSALAKIIAQLKNESECASSLPTGTAARRPGRQLGSRMPDDGGVPRPEVAVFGEQVAEALAGVLGTDLV